MSRAFENPTVPTAWLFGAALTLAPALAVAHEGGSHTSTAGIQFPEEGGKMTPAPMPEGGVTPPWRHEPGAEAPSVEKGRSKVRLDWTGYVRVLFEVIENDSLPFIGRNDGFRLGDARLGLEARYEESLGAFVSIDAAVARATGPNDPNATLSVGPKDAYLWYDAAKRASILLGRFKVPYDLGELEDTEYRVFVDAPLESRGVQRVQGIEVRGMSQGRQLGIMLHKDRLALSEDGFDLGYAVALTNGRTDDLVLADNERPAGFARVSLLWGKYVALNAGGFVDNRTVGELPNLFEEDVKGVEGSLLLKLADLKIEGQLLFQQVEFPTTQVQSVNAMGFHAQWSYRLWDFEAAYRFAWYDPNDNYDFDRTSEHTLALSYYPDAAPLRLSLNGTFAEEERRVENNRIAFLAQFYF